MRIALLLILILVSCTEKKSPDELTGEINEIYSLIYDSVATRSSSSTPWYVVNGLSSFAIEAGDKPENGTIFFSYLNYYEPQFCAIGQTCECSGTSQNNFVMAQSGSGSTNEGVNDKPYNVFDPYSPSSPSTTQTDSSGEIYKIYSYQLGVTPIANDLSSKCREQAIRSINIIRYYSGDIIIQDDYREILFRPRTSN